MRVHFLILFLTAAAGAQQAPLLCPPSPAGRPCDAFHYHVAMYRPDPRGYSELDATTQYATQAACESAREVAVAANAKVAAAMRVKDQKFEADRFGPCHCDMTALTDVQRATQLRAAEDIRLRVRERLLDIKTPPDAEVMRALYSEPPVSAALSTPKIVPLPESAPAPLLTSADDLRPSKTFDTTKPTIAAIDLPLMDIGPPASPPAEQVASTPPVTPASPPAAPTEEPVVEQSVVAEVVEAPTEAEDEEAPDSAEAAAERFISHETERIQNVLRASAAISDETIKTKIFEACMQRIQLLSNLRLLIEGSGSRSALAAAARDAQTEADRLALVARLFSESVKPHWAPRDAAEVVFDVEAAITAAPESALRDTTGRFSAEQKRRALYLVLAQTQPTEDQRLWLSTVVEGFLR
ncbi:MAG TPA: hypothetical protein VNI54_01465 [Thermoanaerobaculia bacterium]|nr:hypothetical protein [Thermoanaerobaculia bacterium]